MDFDLDRTYYVLTFDLVSSFIFLLFFGYMCSVV